VGGYGRPRRAGVTDDGAFLSPLTDEDVVA
jgi:hypothetical protein